MKTTGFHLFESRPIVGAETGWTPVVGVQTRAMGEEAKGKGEGQGQGGKAKGKGGRSGHPRPIKK